MAVNLSPMLNQIATAAGAPFQSTPGLLSGITRGLAPMPSVDPNNPGSLRMAAVESLRRGDTVSAQRYSTLANQLEAASAVKREELRLGQQDVMANLENTRARAVAQRQAFVEAQEKEAERKRTDNIASLLESLGKDAEAQLVRTIGDTEARNKIAQKALENKDRKTDVVEVLDENGNKQAKLIDTQTGEDIAVIGVTEPAVKPLTAKEIAAAEEASRKLGVQTVSALKDINGRLKTIEIVEGLIDKGAAGPDYAVFQIVPGSDSFSLRNALKPLQSQEALGKLKEMRDSSASGASGLGQVTARELDLLIANLTALDPLDALFPQQVQRIKKNVENIRDIFTGKSPDIDWTFYEEQEFSKVYKGVRYIKDLADPTGKGWLIVGEI